ncbi:FCD domain-containing protein [Streptomyces sp. 3MP-14]|uniref:FCD domain-containing protein n=1 Tax=Streptomyces mimosae TaxID=2586635 RepID=A0A5N6A8S5_9ACTN|nr:MULTISPECIES: FadR/GntR family transcriptional regulator [Streptomyces]KAB8164632.1 FCD domain-containing protein [Streptomyces mimosae]KAB8175548.1 FCD domain-containing protein [Streptomyces sp. 3MP-14]
MNPPRPTDAERPVRTITRAELARHLETLIFSGEAAPGTKLPSERRLSEEHGVSRPAVREVLRGLEERGLIEVQAGRGAFVRQLTEAADLGPIDTIYRRRRPTPRDVIEARLMLEQRTVRSAAEKATPEDLALIREALTRFERADDLLARARADVDFHSAVAAAAHNPVIETMFASIRTMCFELMMRSLADPTVHRKGVPYHREIVDAISAGDAAGAERAIAAHLQVALDHYGADLDRPLDLVAQREMHRLMANER